MEIEFIMQILSNQSMFNFAFCVGQRFNGIHW